MSTTYLKHLKAYKSRTAKNDNLYVLLACTAESNICPISYHWWAVATGYEWQIMQEICDLAADVHSGMIRAGARTASGFVRSGEKILADAAICDGRIPELSEVNLIYFENDPLPLEFARFEKLDRFRIKSFVGTKTLALRTPTIHTLHEGFEIRDQYTRYLENSKTGAVNPAYVKERMNNCYTFSDEIKNLFR